MSDLPAELGSLSSLRTLDIRDNSIQQLPKHLAYIRTLEVSSCSTCSTCSRASCSSIKRLRLLQSFSLDAATMTYPPASVCAEGTESIQRFLCSGTTRTRTRADVGPPGEQPSSSSSCCCDPQSWGRSTALRLSICCRFWRVTPPNRVLTVWTGWSGPGRWVHVHRHTDPGFNSFNIFLF